MFSLKYRNLYTKYIIQRSWIVVSEQSEDATKGLRVINSLDPSVLKSID